ncbi:hypothetical protein KJ855_03980 [Patescibacteria group bacterium]|nr:hypothetical protein [Patescibacteria group bacterium]
MESLNSRQQSILRMIVSDYVKSVRPIGSAWLVKRHKMGCCSATVRNDMTLLEDIGLICQPHSSSGRIPTVRGYRYFIDNLMSVKNLPPRFRRRISVLLDSMDSAKYSHAVKVLACEVAGFTGNLTVVSMPEGRIQMTGIEHFLRHPEFKKEEQINRVGILLDRMDQVLFDLRNDLPEGGYRVYLDQDMDFDFTGEMAIVLKKFRDPFGEKHVFGTVGPVRMDYAMLPEVMDYAVKCLEEF